MPRVTLVRIVLLIATGYITLVALFVFLPSFPSVHGGNFSHYHQDILRDGRTLTSVYDNIDVYRSSLDTEYDPRRCFAVQWQLVKDEAAQALLLGVGYGTNRKINLTKLAKASLSSTKLTTSEVVQATARLSVDVGGISLPWFDPSDACLIEWESGRETKPLEIRAILMAPGVVQIWPENSLWDMEPWYADYMPKSTSDLKPFMTISNIPVTKDGVNIAQIQIDDMTWKVPTRTFGLRYSIFIFLKPITLTAIEIINQWIKPVMNIIAAGAWLIIQGSFIFTLIVIGCWLCAGRPPFEGWVLNLPVVKHIFSTRRANSPSRLDQMNSGGSKHDHEQDLSPHRDANARYVMHGTLVSPLDFFRSRSPLDDLFNTFEVTRWMIRPLWTTQSQSGNGSDHVPGTEHGYHDPEAC